MTPVSNNHDHQQPTGSLEELFRQKFAEAELTPRAAVWEQLDHELLVRENQGYRKRLVGYRRAAAAAAVLAVLGLGGLYTQHNLGTHNTANNATATVFTQAGQQGLADATVASANNNLGAASQAAEATAAAGNSRRALGAATGANTAAAGRNLGNAAAGSVAMQAGSAARRATALLGDAAPSRSAAGRALAAIKQTFGGSVEGSLQEPGMFRTRSVGPNSSSRTAIAQAQAPAAGNGGNYVASELQPMATQLRQAGFGGNLLNPDSIKRALQSVPVQQAVAQAATRANNEQDKEKEATRPNRWRWRSGYSAERYVPNVSSPTGEGLALHKAAAPLTNFMAPPPAPTKLQPGLAQRGHLGGAISLDNKHWTLLTGVELTSISGETMRETPRQYQSYYPGADRSNQAQQEGRYRMTTAGVPVQLRYQGRKPGVSVYAAVGAAVNVLLRNRTTVGEQTANNDGSYRRLLASARGSAGLRYAPAGGNWQVLLGPEAEAGLSTLNTNPGGQWSERTRPYAVGLSASVEFGGGKVALQP
ncbi:hypothetical protein [Solirubrum puertoriconensis]|uniref:Outer membrane protein beta-barrel domain-containing protein n=1 Tax=Solirubrum puertoriconensis TaxID=1751427 RepID=A0A9X0HI86_SOLP1|nr:hypothetical protein [Solirubrum puertoriconensis]KUG06420.1 hypothetical protein ASU33_03425 [Solirubrum puertoriconensis]